MLLGGHVKNKPRKYRLLSRNRLKVPFSFVPIIIFSFMSLASSAEPAPRGFFVEDLRKSPPAPAFYNLDTHRIEPFPFRQSYAQFIDLVWDRDRERVLFSAKRSPVDPFRVYEKKWPEGEERAVYENALGPFRFLLSPDGERLALQVMGPAAWPTLAIYELGSGRILVLGDGFSPDWSTDGKRLLFLRIPGSLPTRLAEYRVDTDTSTLLLADPVMEAVYTDDADQIVLKTATQSKRCDVFQIWNRRKDVYSPFSSDASRRRDCPSQREINAFPGHQFFYFKESPSPTQTELQDVVVSDAWGGRLQVISRSIWDPAVTVVDATTLALGRDPVSILPADGTGGRREINGAGLIRFKK